MIPLLGDEACSIRVRRHHVTEAIVQTTHTKRDAAEHNKRVAFKSRLDMPADALRLPDVLLEASKDLRLSKPLGATLTIA